jgi:hypothetical protein
VVDDHVGAPGSPPSSAEMGGPAGPRANDEARGLADAVPTLEPSACYGSGVNEGKDAVPRPRRRTDDQWFRVGSKDFQCPGAGAPVTYDEVRTRALWNLGCCADRELAHPSCKRLLCTSS